MVGRFMDNELEGMWKEEFAVILRVYPCIRAEGTKENREKPQDTCCSGRHLNLAPPEYADSVAARAN
jgi:hypothetical protein